MNVHVDVDLINFVMVQHGANLLLDGGHKRAPNDLIKMEKPIE